MVGFKIYCPEQFVQELPSDALPEQKFTSNKILPTPKFVGVEVCPEQKFTTDEKFP